ncbi:MAG: hypothetical protein HRU25_13210 [Psychrobium sp.]|nr:hypothetical protein [Psychrobium sp.]
MEATLLAMGITSKDDLITIDTIIEHSKNLFCGKNNDANKALGNANAEQPPINTSPPISKSKH